MHIHICDPSPVYRLGLRQILMALTGRAAEVTEFDDPPEVRRLPAAPAAPVFVFTELRFPGGPRPAGIVAGPAQQAAKVVAVSTVDDAGMLMDAIRAGVVGYIPKSLDTNAVREACARLLSGDTYLPLPGDLVTVPATSVGADAAFASDDAPAAPAVAADLTHRQREVFTLLSMGFTNAEIAGRMGLSVHTVRGHVSALLRASGAANRAQIIAQRR